MITGINKKKKKKKKNTSRGSESTYQILRFRSHGPQTGKARR